MSYLFLPILFYYFPLSLIYLAIPTTLVELVVNPCTTIGPPALPPVAVIGVPGGMAPSIRILVKIALVISSTLITSICKSIFEAPLSKGKIPIPISFLRSIIFDAISIALKPSLNCAPINIEFLSIGVTPEGTLNNLFINCEIKTSVPATPNAFAISL